MQFMITFNIQYCLEIRIYTLIVRCKDRTLLSRFSSARYRCDFYFDIV